MYSPIEIPKKEVNRLVEIGVLRKKPEYKLVFHIFLVPKKQGTISFMARFVEMNKRIVQTPYPIPKISTVLQEIDGFTYATSFDLNMGYCTIRLDGNAQRICTLILP